MRDSVLSLAISRTAATATSGRARHWQRERDELSRRTPANGDDDELPALIGVGHRHGGLTAGHGDLGDVLTGLLLVRVKDRTSRRAFAANEQRFRHDE